MQATGELEMYRTEKITLAINTVPAVLLFIFPVFEDWSLNRIRLIRFCGKRFRNAIHISLDMYFLLDTFFLSRFRTEKENRYSIGYRKTDIH